MNDSKPEEVMAYNVNGRNQEIRQNLLGLARDILGRNAHMEWESNKVWNPVSVDNVIEEADKMFNFVGSQD